jgi:hypothetical protein
LTDRPVVGKVAYMTPPWLTRLDDDRRRRRVQILAELADMSVQRGRVEARRSRAERLRQLQSARRRAH